MADHEDYLPGEQPAAHKVSHQDGGADEITVEGLAGELAAEQKSAWAKVSGKPGTFTPTAHKLSHQNGGADEISVAGLAGETAELAAHKILPAIHHVKFTSAEARAAINNIFGADGKADVDINLDTHKLINVVDPVTDQGGDTKKARENALTTHAGLPTVHQDAPGLIETHRLVAAAHHAAYTDAKARAAMSPISLSPAAFWPIFDTYDYDQGGNFLKNRIALTAQYYQANVSFPPGVTITKLTFFAYRDDALSDTSITLYRVGRTGALSAMATVVANWIDGYNSSYDDSIVYAVIDNVDYSYLLQCSIEPNDNVLDVRLVGAMIDFTG